MRHMTILPLVLSFNKRFPNIKNMIDEHWDILTINEKLNVLNKKCSLSLEEIKICTK